MSGLLVTVVVVLALLCCGGVLYGGWIQPMREKADTEEFFVELGVPKGFVVNEPRFLAGTETLSAEYEMLCPRQACPVNPAEAIHEWMAGNRMSHMTVQDVQRCLGWAADPSPELCDLGWTVEDTHIEVYAIWDFIDGQPEDRQWVLKTQIYQN
ncbi:hypothetical protein ACFP2T_16855 [Plantactinospora solaniradicis]|uniref:Uncharacterized protein n=1 Tax=Plantactinospora solaniradicis TaxID=1723736 RepID=A0ABW1K9C3_9ACTN